MNDIIYEKGGLGGRKGGRIPANFLFRGTGWQVQYFVAKVSLYSENSLFVPTNYMFQIDHQYTKADIYKILKVPPQAQRGAWDTGYREYNGAIFIFANIGVAGRTGHDYDNHWHGSDLIWYSKPNAKVGHKHISLMLDPNSTVYIFTREDDRAPFTYNGIGKLKGIPQESNPIKITWIVNKSSILRERNSGQVAIREALNDIEKRKIIQEYRSRNGQSQLKTNLMKLYKGKCCISGSSIAAILHACHIIPHAESGNNKSANALLLRSDIHDLFDSYLLGINPIDFRITVSESLRYTEYYRFNGVKLARRYDKRTPDSIALQKRWMEFLNHRLSNGK